MTNLANSSNKYSTRTPKIIGRDEEIKLIKNCLHASGNHFLYFWALGGLGKTRLLEEVQHLVAEAGPGYYFSGILDLYHSDMHSNSDIERTIVENIDPDNKYFKTYREKRHAYELLRERGTDPQTLEARRQELRNIFVNEERDLASKAYKVVICIDTVELLQYESSTVEQLAGSIDTRIKTWILDKLPKLNNVLVVFTGRPKTSTAPEGLAETETLDHHKRLIDDFQKAFGKQFTVKELEPLTKEQVQQFILDLTQTPDFISGIQLPVVHKLTGGNPVFLHLMVDLIQVISPEPRLIYEMFDGYSHLAMVADDDPALLVARKQIESELLSCIFNSGELSGYLSQIALLPKGVNREIFTKVLGLTDDEANQLFASLMDLSFVKIPKALPGGVRVHEERIFFHDELYRILSPKVIPNLRNNERTLAQSLLTNYYASLIQELQNRIDDTSTMPEDRVALRERIHKLLVERMYYLLVRSPREGYLEYQRLTEYANRFRQVGFAMRLLDEFLRFYNDIPRRNQFKNAGISHEQIVRESVQMWTERLHWWGEREQEIGFTKKILDAPSRFYIVPETETGILANVIALWARAETMQLGYDPDVVARLQYVLDKMPSMENCDPNQLLGLGRLLTSIGYAYRQGGLLEQAVKPNDQAISCFRRLGTHPEELAIVLNNQAYVIAKQGLTTQGRTLALEALRINDENQTLYAAGLSRTILASIERMALEDYSEAEKWALEAKDIFEIQLSDPHGAIRSYLNLGGAWRKIAERDVERGRSLVAAINKLKEAVEILEKGISQAIAAKYPSEIPGLKAELGKVNRSIGRLYTRQGGLALGIPYLRESERLFGDALAWPKWNDAEKADITEDLAEVYYLMGDQSATEKSLGKVWDLLGECCRLEPGNMPVTSSIPNRYYLPLGKVERLKGEMAMSRKDYQEGLQHFTTANAYFERYSRTAVEKNKMTETLFSTFLSRLPSSQQQLLMRDLRAWMGIYQYQIGGVHVQEFVDSLGRLMGA